MFSNLGSLSKNEIKTDILPGLKFEEGGFRILKNILHLEKLQ